MKKRRFYSMWAKTLVVAVMLAAAVVTGIWGSCFLTAMNTGMTVSEASDPIPYESSTRALSYLNSETHTILENQSHISRFCVDGKYDENATVDISDMTTGVAKEKKNANLEYRLGDLCDFYNSDGRIMLQYLLSSYEEYTMSEVDEGEEVFSETAEVYGSKAELKGTRSVLVDRNAYSDENEGTGLESGIAYSVKCYDTTYNVLYNNGIEIEKKYIQNASGKTIADYAQDNLSSVSIIDCYNRLIDAAAQVNEYRKAVPEETNARLYVKNLKTGKIFSNVSGWESLADVSAVKEAYEKSVKTTAYYLWDGNLEESTCADPGEVASYGSALRSAAEVNLGGGTYQIFVGLDTGYPVKQSMSYRDQKAYEWYLKNQIFAPVNPLVIIFTGLAVMIIMLILLAFQTGHRPEDREIHPVAADRFPIEIYFIMDICLWVGVISMFCEAMSVYNRYSYLYDSNYLDFGSIMLNSGALIVGTLVCGVLLLAWELKRYGRRIKEKSLGGSIIKSICSGIKKAAESAYRARKENQKLIILYTGFVLIQFIILLVAGAAGGSGNGGIALILAVLIIIFDIFVLLQLLKNISGRDEVKKGMDEIARGNLDYQINTEHMSGDNRDMADELNRVREGLKHAVEAEMKSERLKTDLITNVSHDIKTPLTSIINYVDILKRENIQDEKIAGYIRILDRKAARLKQLTEDLVEASKISSGNITLDMQKINLKQLIKQTNGEFEEKFGEKQLELICELPEAEMLILADGRRMFRVIENLYNNAAKYAMPHSRVYVNGEIKGGKVIFSMKNMSENPLNFKADELLERFVRGDVSRSTEGSGLGLEIARNLTLMQNGTFDLYVDGDLFKVTITFDAV